MKKCPHHCNLYGYRQAHEVFESELNFCPYCGTKLVPNEDTIEKVKVTFT